MNYIIQIHREGIMKKILVVDDEKRIREIIVMYLIKEGYDVMILIMRIQLMIILN